MKFKLSFSCEGAAFEDNELMFAVADTLRGVADQIAQFECGVDEPMTIFDFNGNRIGEAEFEVDPSRYGS